MNYIILKKRLFSIIHVFLLSFSTVYFYLNLEKEMLLEKYLVLLRKSHILKSQVYSEFHKILVFNYTPSLVGLAEFCHKLFLSLYL